MNPEGVARPGSRPGARAARDAAPHWCREPPVAAAPGLMRDETGSGSRLCRRGCTRAVAWPVALLAATTRRPVARPETAPLVLTPNGQPQLGAPCVGLLDQLFLAVV